MSAMVCTARLRKRKPRNNYCSPIVCDTSSSHHGKRFETIHTCFRHQSVDVIDAVKIDIDFLAHPTCKHLIINNYALIRCCGHAWNKSVASHVTYTFTPHGQARARCQGEVVNSELRDVRFPMRASGPVKPSRQIRDIVQAVFDDVDEGC